MNKFILSTIIASSLLACNQSARKEEPVADKTTIDESKLAKPVRYVNWEMGDFNNVVTVTNLYKMWDNREGKGGVESYFADTIRLRLPEETDEIVIPNSQINARLLANRNMYGATSNDLVSAVALHDKTSGEDWVMVTTFAKWTEKSGKRDSVLYHDDWRITKGKIDFLWSFSKTPSAEFLKNNPAK